MSDAGGTVDEAELRTAIAAVLHGVVMRGFDGPDGVSKDEALDYAIVLARWTERLVEQATLYGDAWLRRDPDGSLRVLHNPNVVITERPQLGRADAQSGRTS